MKFALSMIALLSISAQAHAQGVDTFDRETGNVHNPAECSAPGTDQYSVLRHDNGAGVTWQITNDTRLCSQGWHQRSGVPSRRQLISDRTGLERARPCGLKPRGRVIR